MGITIRERGQKVADYIKNNVNASVRAIAVATGLTKSSVHRHLQGIDRRRQYSESHWWETAQGYGFLIRLVYGVIYFFGIKQGVGAETISEFFQAIHLDTHVASSASALRDLKRDITQLIIDYGEAQSEHCQPSEKQGIVLGGDETFFGLPVLVLIELASGYIFTEIECANRTYTTWLVQLERWWDKQRWHCHYFVSDGARALIKLATAGLGCVNVADLFHALRALGCPIGRALAGQLAQLNKQYDRLEKQLNSCAEALEQQSISSLIEENKAQQYCLEQDQLTYRQTLEQITQRLHPFHHHTQHWQLGDALTTHLAPPLQTLTMLAQSYGQEKALKAIETFQTQIASFSEGIEAWHQWLEVDLQSQTQEKGLQEWVLSALLPWVYWTQQADKTRQPALKHHYQQVASNAYDGLFEHPLTLSLLPVDWDRWILWSQEFCTKYQRTSSAIEGRNGRLSQLHHSGRGFSEQTLKALTIIHNFDIKRPDRTTPAQRLFGHPFPDLFEWLLEHSQALPRPRRSSKAQKPKPLYAKDVPV